MIPRGKADMRREKPSAVPPGKPHKGPDRQPEMAEAKYDPSRVDEDGGLSAIPEDDR